MSVTSSSSPCLYGILGYPLGHSLSPLLHNWGFKRRGIPGAYHVFEKTAEDLPEFMRAVRSLPVSGLSVTIPHKQAVPPFLDALTPRAKNAGAVNTLFWDRGALTGDNTDVPGFLAPLRGRKIASALVLGAGGACRAVLAGLAEIGVQTVVVAARSEDKAREAARAFGFRAGAWEERAAALPDFAPDLVVNATPLGMRGRHEGQSPLPAEAWAELASRNASALAYDLVYNPGETRFMADARAAGCAVRGGLDFFVAQGLEQFRLWTGTELPAEEARALVAAALAARG